MRRKLDEAAKRLFIGDVVLRALPARAAGSLATYQPQAYIALDIGRRSTLIRRTATAWGRSRGWREARRRGS